ncbi:MAG: glutamate--tRNA ligase [Oscillospiraceae bacterium]|jgi:glutamyl-tRNA synthetase|nr:glutamate--tRNA ligase [Oscillospiraceae bacterium]
MMFDFDNIEAQIPHNGVRTRFAPSPTGYMHVGGLRTALYTYLIAKKAGGAFILRIEDTDQNRFVEGATEIIYSTLRGAGINWDEGPDVGGPTPPYIQSERREIYAAYAEKLVELGGAYRDGDVIRQKIPREGETTFTDLIFGDITVQNDSASMDEGVLLKSDGLPTYNFANVIDDHLMGITHVVRGSEYLSSAPKYVLLYNAFGWEMPQYITVSPVMRDAQHKLSKRNGDPTYDDLLTQGYLTDAIVNYVALLGWSPGGEREIFTLRELEEVFDVGGLSKSPAIFDVAKLRYFNAEYIRALPPGIFAALAEPYIRQSVKNPNADIAALAELVQARCEVLTDIPEKLDFIDALPEYPAELYVHKKSKTDGKISLDMLKSILPELEALPDWTRDGVYGVCEALAAKLDAKNALVMWPLRIAVSGKAVTPGGAAEICAVLGREESLRRIDAGIKKLEAE